MYLFGKTLFTGKIVDEHLSVINSWTTKPHVVTGDWIVESAKLQKPAEEAEFLYLTTNNNKNVKSNMSPPKQIRATQLPAVSQVDCDRTNVGDDLMNQYLNNYNSEDNSMNDSALPSSQAAMISGIFGGELFL